MDDTTVRAATAPAAAPVVPTRVLVLGMAHEDGTILPAELHPVAEACGLTGEQVRSCLRRLVGEGILERHGSGREARYAATPRGLAELGHVAERTRLAYAQDAAGRGWDRQWRLVAFAIPERERQARDALRDQLLELGGASIHGGLYVSPHPWHGDVAAAASALGVASSLTLATTDDLTVGGERDPRTLARLLWPVDALAARYERFNQRFAGVVDALAGMRRRHERLADSAFLPGALAMGVAFADCFEGDPLLPPELLPRPWPGRTARELVVKSRRLALQLRKDHGRPALFRATFDDAVASIP